MRLATYGLLACLAACGGNGPDGEGPIQLDGGGSGSGVSTPVNWTIRRGGTVLNCANAGATEVYITAKPEEGLDVTKTYPCVLAPVMVSLPAGRYAIEGALMGPGVYVSAPAKAVTVPVQAQVMIDFYLQ